MLLSEKYIHLFTGLFIGAVANNVTDILLAKKKSEFVNKMKTLSVPISNDEESIPFSHDKKIHTSLNFYTLLMFSDGVFNTLQNNINISDMQKWLYTENAWISDLEYSFYIFPIWNDPFRSLESPNLSFPFLNQNVYTHLKTNRSCIKQYAIMLWKYLAVHGILLYVETGDSIDDFISAVFVLKDILLRSFTSNLQWQQFIRVFYSLLCFQYNKVAIQIFMALNSELRDEPLNENYLQMLYHLIFNRKAISSKTLRVVHLNSIQTKPIQSNQVLQQWSLDEPLDNENVWFLTQIETQIKSDFIPKTLSDLFREKMIESKFLNSQVPMLTNSDHILPPTTPTSSPRFWRKWLGLS